VLLAQGKTSDAEAAQRDALRRDPRFLDAWARLGDVIALAGPSRYLEAVDAYRRASPVAGGVRARSYRLLRLVAASDASKTADADAEWEALVALAGREMLANGGLDPPATKPADPAREEKDLRAALEARPDDAKTRCKYATLLHRRGDVDDAIAEYAEAAAAAPNDASIRTAYGAALLAKGDPAAAQKELETAVKLDRTNALALRDHGWSLLRLGRFGESVDAFSASLAVRADRLARLGRGLARLHLGNDEGLADLAAAGWTAP